MTFIGPKPEVEEPKIVTPVHADGVVLRDQRGHYLGEVSAVGLTASEDEALTELIVEALNEKFGREKAEAKPESKLRTLIGWYLDGEFVDDQRVYEVSPGRFIWAKTRAEAEEHPNWSWEFPNNIYRFVDVETGEEVTA